MSEKEINKEQLQKEIDQELNSTILAMAQDPSNADNYHTLAKLYAMDNKCSLFSSANTGKLIMKRFCGHIQRLIL